MQIELKYRVLIGISAMTLLFVSFLISYVSSQRKKLKFRQEMEKLREIQQNQLLEAAIKSEEIERHRIAETLHDEVGAILSSAKLHLLGIKANSLDSRDLILHEKGKILLDDAIQKVRGISHNLHSNILKEFGLHEAISHFVKSITESSLIHSSIHFDDNLADIGSGNDISVYRLVQELINNIIKHASAKEISFSSSMENEQLVFTISHNGFGITFEEYEQLRYKKNGLGLKNIQNRITLLKGNIDFLKSGKIYKVVFKIPIRK